ncbi:Lrp/AsnC family transcriptional regulator [Roseateles cavernae]|uniref:Lrp/AsnC family transcriptional regulator n=1 Tax=Roseateles cavernae TaxID=3153578 RepID=UPI0032E45C0A
MMTLDALDKRIVALYQEDTTRSGEWLGARVGLSAAAVQRRLKRLREQGVILAEVARLDPRALGLHLTALVHVDLVDESALAAGAFCQRLLARPEVQQCYGVTGEADYVLVIVVADLPAYEAFCAACLLHDANVRSFKTQIVLDAVRRAGPLAIPD